MNDAADGPAELTTTASPQPTPPPPSAPTTSPPASPSPTTTTLTARSAKRLARREYQHQQKRRKKEEALLQRQQAAQSLANGQSSVHQASTDDGQAHDEPAAPVTTVDTISYYIDPLTHNRHVYPYHLTYQAYCKQRWIGQSLIHTFSTEFVAYTRQYYERAIAAGKIKVNDKQVDAGYVLKDSDLITHTTHQHEPAITSALPTIHSSARNPQIFIVNKPATIPMHPTGKFKYSTLRHLLAKLYPQYPQLHFIHRLDRCTSGLVIGTTDRYYASVLSQQIVDHEMSKYYVARVQGCFSEKNKTDVVHCREAIGCYNHQYSYHQVATDDNKHCLTGIKQCHTAFKFLSHDADSNTSLVQCQPYTGRTHQIRVHLQHLGHVIANDVRYGGSKDVKYSAKRLADADITPSNLCADTEERIIQQILAAHYDDTCNDCADPDVINGQQLIVPPSCELSDLDKVIIDRSQHLQSESIWLHAYRYESVVGVFEVPMPDWA